MSHTDNYLTFCGSKSDLQALQQAVQSASDERQCFCFDRLIPAPKGLGEVQRFIHVRKNSPKSQAEIDNDKRIAENIARFGYEDITDWRKANWGCMSNALYSACGFEDETHLWYQFDARHGWPKPIFEALLKRFPTISVEWNYQMEGDCKRVKLEDGHFEYKDVFNIYSSKALTPEEIARGAERAVTHTTDIH